MRQLTAYAEKFQTMSNQAMSSIEAVEPSQVDALSIGLEQLH
jgi:hypothetical protein